MQASAIYEVVRSATCETNAFIQLADGTYVTVKDVFVDEAGDLVIEGDYEDEESA